MEPLEVVTMDFSSALEACKHGNKIARRGWNGKDMFIVHVAEGFLSVQGAVYPLRPYLAIRNVDRQFCPWLASQTDMLAEDWVVVE